MTNNTNDLPYQSNKKAKVLSFTPSGRISMFDQSLGTRIGIEGVKVKAKRWFTTRIGFADANGYYVCDGSLNGDADYTVEWERYNFEIREGFLNGAEYYSPNHGNNYNVQFDGGVHYFYAIIFRAAYRYYYKDINGLRRPPENAFWSTQLHIRAFDQLDPSGSNGSHCPVCRFAGIGSAIKVYNNMTPTRGADDIFGTTIHELGHASHWNMNSYSYNNAQSVVVESWARGVQWSLTRLEYPTYEPDYGRLQGGFSTPDYFYTGVVQDIIDNDGSPSDFVTGYNIRQVEDALNGEIMWYGWLNRIKNDYDNPTESNVETLFNYWF